MPHPSILLAADRTDGLFPGLEGLPAWFIVIVIALIIGAWNWNSRRRREAAERHMTRDEWEAHLKANDPDLRQDD